MLAPHANGTKYTVLVQHANPVAHVKHKQMGLKEGWRAVLDQLIEMIKG